VWRKQKGVRQKENAIYTFVSGHFSDSKLDLNERYLKEKARMFSVTLLRNWRKCNRKINQFLKVFTKWLEEHLVLKVKEGNSR